MKRVVSSIVVLLTFCLVVGCSCVFLINPGFNKINFSNQMVKLSDEEISKKEQELNNEYANKKTEIDDKYVGLKKELKAKYDEKETEIRTKFDQLIKELDSKYDVPTSNPNWYDNQVNKMHESSSYRSKMIDEISSLTSIEHEEDINLDTQKSIEIRNLRAETDDKIKLLTTEDNTKEDTLKSGKLYVSGGVIIIALFVTYLVLMFNSLIRLRNSVKEKLSQIDVLLKRRVDLIPNIVETVKGYAKHEKDTLEGVIEARNVVLNAHSNKDKLDANSKFGKSIASLFAVIENYPELNSNNNFMNLQEELRETEDKIAISRQRYNKAILKYKNRLEMFPSNLIANICDFKSDDFYTIKEEERENVKVEL